MILERARSACGKGTVYKLGRGGFDPNLPHPGKECDCTGFLAWSMGSSRRVPKTIGWIETTRIVHDATHDGLLFRRVAVPVPGDVVVYGDYVDERTGIRRQGHGGVLSVVPTDLGTASWWDGLRVIHCSVRNSKNGDAIAETDARVFRRRAIFARWHGL